MATKKTAKKATKKIEPVITQKQEENVFETFKFGESYTSLLLGVVVVIIAIVLVVSLVRNRKAEFTQPTQEVSSDKIEKTLDEVAQEELPTEYVVKKGDTLWSIAEKVYKSGYNWVDIVKENKLANGDSVSEGTKLIIPNVTPIVLDSEKVNQEKIAVSPTMTPEEVKQPTEGSKGAVMQSNDTSEKIVGDSYKIVRGDDLWDIAVRAYGDGYKWVEIAKVNNLSDPNLIHADNILKLPR